MWTRWQTHTQAHANTHTHTHTAVSGLRGRHLDSALHTCRWWNYSVQTWRDTKPWLENRSFHRLCSVWTASSVIAPMYQKRRPASAWQPERLRRWGTEKWNYAQDNPDSYCCTQKPVSSWCLCNTEVEFSYSSLSYLRVERNRSPPSRHGGVSVYWGGECRRSRRGKAIGTRACMCAGVCTVLDCIRAHGCVCLWRGSVSQGALAPPQTRLLLTSVSQLADWRENIPAPSFPHPPFPPCIPSSTKQPQPASQAASEVV